MYVFQGMNVLGGRGWNVQDEGMEEGSERQGLGNGSVKRKRVWTGERNSRENGNGEGSGKGVESTGWREGKGRGIEYMYIKVNGGAGESQGWEGGGKGGKNRGKEN
jgi:hypothetical protein